MAIFRKIHTSFWSDSFTSDLNQEQKLFYLYLLTNERTRQCGVYEITKKQISFDLGYSIDKVSILLKYFISKGKIRYNEETKEIAIGNWLKYNLSSSPKVKSCVDKEFNLVKDTLLILYVKSIDTDTQEEEEEEEEKEEEKIKEKKQKKVSFELSEIFDKKKFKEYFSDWNIPKLQYYHASAIAYSAEGNKYIDWGKALSNWAKRDELQGKIRFEQPKNNTYNENSGIL